MFELTINVPGLKHEKLGAPSEDAVATYRAGGAVSVVSCDGVSATKHGGKAAQAIAEDIAVYLATYAGQLNALADDVIRHELLQLVRARQKDLEKRFGMSIDELGTTISAAVLMQDNTCLCVRLGDGMVITREKRTRENKPFIMPEGDADTRETWCTSHSDADILAHLAVKHGEGVDAVAVTSDGMESVLYSRFGRVYSVYDKLLDDLCDKGRAEVVAELQEYTYDLAEDDASLALAMKVLPNNRLLMGKRPDRYLPGKNRRARKVYEYIGLRDEGFSVRDAARRVGWGKPTVFQKRIKYLQDLGLEMTHIHKNILDKSAKRRP